MSAMKNQQYLLTLYTVLTVSRTVTACSLRLFAKLLCQIADRLDVTSKTDFASFDSQPIDHDTVESEPAATTIYDSIKSIEEEEMSNNLDERYNQLLNESTLNQAKNILSNSRLRKDSADSAVGDLDTFENDATETIDEETGLAIVTLDEVGDHCTFDDAWTVIYDRVYDVTDYLCVHPGGEEVIMEYVGYDATVAFRGVNHSRAAFRALEKYCVGILPAAERLNYNPV
eukprot:TRINITY_DN23284_c0_g1_i2.p1 TRINITY_DN23284_c0_g1~~TRINITY_DN23284_c0_g1_i2.p1  ORF type:complete len:252 (-),score=51.27 TRINITY_DN23284_c0_g1_i2:108-794(-)